MSYFDTEITIPVRVHYTAHKGYKQTHWEPGEPASAEIEEIEFLEKIIDSTGEYTTVKYKHHKLEMSYESLQTIVEQNELENEALEDAYEEEQSKMIDAAEARMDAIKHGDY